MASAGDAAEYRERTRDRGGRSPSNTMGSGAPVTGTNGSGASSGSVASASLRRQSSRNVRMSNIESSVTRLLVATKQLIETLTAWSRRQASETDVSDVYVRLGNEFNIARTCFERANIEMTDLADVPSQLRQVLETCLAREASPRILEIYLPKVREIVINLLQGLKRKQARYRARSNDSTTTTANAPQEAGDPASISTAGGTQRYQSPPRQQRIPDSARKPPSSERHHSPARKPVGARDSSTERTTARSSPTTGLPTPQPSNPEIVTSAPSPRLPQPTNEALQKLQTSDALQRRASKRYSAYNFAKLDGIDLETGQMRGVVPPVPARRSGSFSPEVKRSSGVERARKAIPEVPRTTENSAGPDVSQGRRPMPVDEETAGQVKERLSRDSPSPEKIAVFLQLGSSVRRTLVSLTDLTLQSLRLLFVEKFQFNPGADTFPNILVTDRETGVRYILEEGMQDVVDGTVIVLDVEVESGLKKTFNEGIAGLMKEIGTLQETIMSQQTLLTHLTEQHASLKADLTSHRHETIQKIQDISLKSPTFPPPHIIHTPTTLVPALKTLKHDLSTLKSEQASFESVFSASLASLRALPLSQVQIVTGDDLASQKSDLESKTQALVTLSDDLSDQVDDLRIDITQKRVRPHPRTIAAVRKQNATVQSQIAAVETQLKTLKPIWKRKWEEELQQVIDGQEFLRHQETLVTDLKKDLVDTETVITQIVQAAELFESSAPREWLSGAVGSGGRDAVLGEVKTLQPDSAGRLEAIKRAERQRIREMELRRENDFQLELGEVVNSEKMRVQGETAARLELEREQKERRIRKEMWDATRVNPKNESAGGSPRSEDEGGSKRAVSEGFAGNGNSANEDGIVGRSQSHSSALASRARSTGSVGSGITGLQRASTDSNRTSGPRGSIIRED